MTFSQPQAEGLGLNWQEVYQAIFTELQVKHLRLVAYWHILEPQPGVFDFTDLDYQMQVAAEQQAAVILSIGRKVPRWPECHIPAWAAGLPEAEQQQRVLALVQAVVGRYREHPALHMWQLENEPLLSFGHCPPYDPVFLAAEEQLVRSLDERAILITDSGELNSWLPAAAFGDALGTTMYRTVFSSRTQKLFKYDYLLPAWVYRLKARLVFLVHDKPVIISELQGEPWGARPFTEMTAAERTDSISVKRLQEIQRFAARTGLPEAYWWGVEYWYWEKETQDNPAYWETAKSFFKTP